MKWHSCQHRTLIEFISLISIFENVDETATATWMQPRLRPQARGETRNRSRPIEWRHVNSLKFLIWSRIHTQCDVFNWINTFHCYAHIAIHYFNHSFIYSFIPFHFIQIYSIVLNHPFSYSHSFIKLFTQCVVRCCGEREILNSITYCSHLLLCRVVSCRSV